MITFELDFRPISSGAFANVRTNIVVYDSGGPRLELPYHIPPSPPSPLIFTAGRDLVFPPTPGESSGRSNASNYRIAKRAKNIVHVPIVATLTFRGFSVNQKVTEHENTTCSPPGFCMSASYIPARSIVIHYTSINKLYTTSPKPRRSLSATFRSMTSRAGSATSTVVVRSRILVFEQIWFLEPSFRKLRKNLAVLKPECISQTLRWLLDHSFLHLLFAIGLTRWSHPRVCASMATRASRSHSARPAVGQVILGPNLSITQAQPEFSSFGYS